MQKLVLYSTLGCHLCDEAKTVVETVLTLPAFADLPIVFETVDIANTEALVSLYGERIPVIKLISDEFEEFELCWPFDEIVFVDWWIAALQ